MTRMPYRKLLAPVALAAGLALSACSADNSAPAAGANGTLTYLGKESIPETKAEKVFYQTCMSCHATGVGPDILGRELHPDAVKLFVRNGNRAMPAFPESAIDDETLNEVAQMVFASTGPASRVKQ